MADPKRVADEFLAGYAVPADQKFSPFSQLEVRPKSQHDLPTRDRSKNDTHEQPESYTDSDLPGDDEEGEVSAGDPNDDQSYDTSRWPVQQSPNREKQRNLPLPSGHPPDRTRSLVRPVYNVPDAEPGSRGRPKTITPVRTPGTPGEEYGHPTKYDYNTVTRRNMEAVQAGLKTIFPKKRQRKQLGPAKRYHRRYYKRHRSPIKRKVLRRLRRVKRTRQYKRDQKYRDLYPKRYTRRPPGIRTNAERAQKWRKEHKRQERDRGLKQRKDRERRQDQRRKKRQKEQKRTRKRNRKGAEEEIWRFPVMLGDDLVPVVIVDFDDETGDVVYEHMDGEEDFLHVYDFLDEVVPYEEKDVEWLFDILEDEFGEVFDPEDEMTVQANWDVLDVLDEYDDDVDERTGAYQTFYRVQDKPSNLDQNAPTEKTPKGTPRQDRERNDYMYGPPSPGGSKGKEAPTSWVGPMTGQPGIADPSKDHKHPGQPHGNPDLSSGFQQPAVEQQSGSAKVIPDENRSTGDLSWRNKNKDRRDRDSKVADDPTWLETEGGLIPIEVLGYDPETRGVIVQTASIGDPPFMVPGNAVFCERDASVNDKTADTIPMIRRRAERALFEKARSRPASLVKFEKRRLTWTFKSGKWQVKLRALPAAGEKAVNVMKMHIRCACSCPFWRWQGPEHWGKKYKWQYGRPRGTATFPKIRDPKFRKPVCKHVLAVFDYVQSQKLKIPAESRKPKLARYSADKTPVCEHPSPSRVAGRFLGKSR